MPAEGVFSCALTIKSDTRYLSFLRQWVDAAAAAAGRRLGGRARVALKLALVEAVDNAIFHAHGGDGRIPIKVEITFRDDEATVQVVDTGRGIGHPSKILPGLMSDHGRGLFLMRSMMTSVRSRVKDGRHSLRMKLAI
ncbi:MAG: ATP-binding protein [bacterium]|nr:ATP-binding protein [Candidatus Portnoybacteria bacterium]